MLELEGAELIMNPATVALGHLAGRNERKYPWSPWGQQWSAVARPSEWLVRVTDPERAIVTVRALSQKAGSHARTLQLREG